MKKKWKDWNKCICHACTGGEIPGIIRPYPTIACSHCKLPDIMAGRSYNVRMTRTELQEYNKRLRDEQRRKKEGA